MRRCRLILALFMMVVLMIASTSSIEAQSAEKNPGTPKISVKVMDNGSDVQITIKKTKGAVGFEVWMTTDVKYKGYSNLNYDFNSDLVENSSGNFVNAATIEKNGKKNRTITLKNVPYGTVSVKVRAFSGYTQDYWGYTVREYGPFSKVKNVKISNQNETNNSFTKDYTKVKKGDTIEFGSYEQSYPIDGKDPIKWIVLDRTDEELLLLSKYGLDFVPYDCKPSETDGTWEKCSLRKWLNEVFYSVAFNETEKDMIKTVTIRNGENPRVEAHFDWENGEEQENGVTVYYPVEQVQVTDDGNPTEVNVFLLTTEDVTNDSYGFSKNTEEFDESRKCEYTDYAFAQGSYSLDKYEKKEDRTCVWGLRSHGDYSQTSIVTVEKNGKVFNSGRYLADISVAVRPVIYVKIK